MNNPNRATDFPKSHLDRLSELFNALLIMKDLISLVEKGLYYHIIPIYGQLRALLTDKTQRGPNKPLFLEVLANLSPDASLYYLEYLDKHTIGDESEPFKIQASTLLMSIERTNPNQVEGSIVELLGKTVLVIGTRRLSLSDFINTYSDKFGGSHYDGAIPQHIFDLHSFGMGSPNFIALHFARTLIGFGAKALKEICDFEIIIDLFFKKIKPGKHVVFDLLSPSTRHRITIYVANNNLEVLLVDFFGTKSLHVSENVLSDNSGYLIDVTYEIIPSLEAVLSVRINGNSVYSNNINPPLLSNNQLRGYEWFINRTREVEYQDFEFGMRALLLPIKILNNNDRIMMEWEVESQRAGRSYWYGPGGYGYSKSDEGDIHNTGNVSLGLN